MHDQDAVRHAENLLHLGAGEENGHAAFGQLLHQPIDLLLGAHVDAAGRLVEQEHARLQGQPLPQNHLLLVAARQVLDDLVGAGRADVETLDHRLRVARFALPIGKAQGAAVAAQAGQADIVAQAHLQDQALLLAVLGNQGQAGADGVDRVAQFHGLAVDADPSGQGRNDAEQSLEQLGAAGAHQAGDADDLAAANRETQRMPRPGGHGQILHLQHRVAHRVRPPGVELRHIAAHHQRYHGVVGDRPGAQFAGIGAVAQHQDAIGQPLYLAQAVGDVDDADTTGAQLADDGEQHLGLFAGETGGRFIHDQHAGIGGQGFGDLHQLAAADGQAADRNIGRDVEADPPQDLPRLPVHGLSVDQPAAARLAAQKDIGADAQVVAEVEFLVDQGDAQVRGRAGGIDAHRAVAEEDLASVGQLHPGQDFHQGRLARSVLADDGQHFARLQGQVHVAQGEDPRKTPGDAGGAKQGHSTG